MIGEKEEGVLTVLFAVCAEVLVDLTQVFFAEELTDKRLTCFLRDATDLFAVFA